MAGYKRMYIFGGSGGFMGADGVNPVSMQIWVGVSDGKWLEAHYFKNEFKPIAGIKTIVPKKPDEYSNLLEATILFAPLFFEKCSMLKKVRSYFEKLGKKQLFMHKDEPEFWGQMLKEAEPIFKKLNIYQADIMDIDKIKNIKGDY